MATVAAPSSLIFAVCMALSVLAALALMLLAPRAPRLAAALAAIDVFFDRDHFAPLGGALRRQRTALGGALTVATVVAAAGVVVNVVISYATGIVVVNSGFLPASRLDVVSASAAEFELSVFLASPVDSPCVGVDALVSSASSAWSFEQIPSASTASADFGTVCAYLGRCSGCSPTSSQALLFSLPFWFSSGAWTFASLGACNGAPSPRACPLDLLSGNWTAASFLPTTQTTSLGLSLTVDARRTDTETTTGSFATLSSDSTVVDAASNAPGNSLSVKIDPSGLVFLTQVATGQTAVVEAFSVLLGGVTGIIAFFRWVLSNLEGATVGREQPLLADADADADAAPPDTPTAPFRKQRRNSDSDPLAQPLHPDHV
jgi:hypothetical protein